MARAKTASQFGVFRKCQEYFFLPSEYANIYSALSFRGLFRFFFFLIIIISFKFHEEIWYYNIKNK